MDPREVWRAAFGAFAEEVLASEAAVGRSLIDSSSKSSSMPAAAYEDSSPLGIDDRREVMYPPSGARMLPPRAGDGAPASLEGVSASTLSPDMLMPSVASIPRRHLRPRSERMWIVEPGGSRRSIARSSESMPYGQPMMMMVMGGWKASWNCEAWYPSSSGLRGRYEDGGGQQRGTLSDGSGDATAPEETSAKLAMPPDANAEAAERAESLERIVAKSVLMREPARSKIRRRRPEGDFDFVLTCRAASYDCSALTKLVAAENHDLSAPPPGGTILFASLNESAMTRRLSVRSILRLSCGASVRRSASRLVTWLNDVRLVPGDVAKSSPEGPPPPNAGRWFSLPRSLPDEATLSSSPPTPSRTASTPPRTTPSTPSFTFSTTVNSPSSASGSASTALSRDGPSVQRRFFRLAAQLRRPSARLICFSCPPNIVSSSSPSSWRTPRTTP